MNNAVNAIGSVIDNAEILSTGDDTPNASDDSGATPDKRSRGRPKGARNRKREKQADGIIGLMDECELWRDKKGVPFVTYPVGDHRENWQINSECFNDWITLQAYKSSGSVPGQEAIKQALSVQAARAREGLIFEPARRVGGYNGKIFLDLCDDQWRVIEIDRNGWRLAENCPVKFIRSPAMLPLPMPAEDDGGPNAINRLWDFCNFASESDFVLVVGWLVAALREKGLYPVLVVNGPPGTGKSTFTRLIRGIVDPSLLAIRAVPQNKDELITGAYNSHVLAVDNISKLDHWLSDHLCQISTGSAFPKRSLYTDHSESVISAMCPLVLNGIPFLTEQSDLAQRSIIIRLREIDDSERTTEDELWTKWRQTEPAILGGLLTGVSAALRNLSRIRFDELPRMADFARWAVAASSAFGFAEGQFMEAYNEKSKDISADVFEANLVAMGIADLLEREPGGRFEGNATALLERLNSYATEATKKQRSWPQIHVSLGKTLDRIKPLLKQHGIVCKFHKSNGRCWSISKMAKA